MQDNLDVRARAEELPQIAQVAHYVDDEIKRSACSNGNADARNDYF